MDNLFYDRLNDLISDAESGIPRSGHFLDPAKQYEAERIFNSFSRSCRMLLWGGYEDAERKMLFVLPDYFEEFDDDNSITREFISSNLECVLISGSGYVELDHRSFLGALCSLGIDRSHLGDIIVCDSKCAYLFCDSSIADFLTSAEKPLTSIGRDKVKVKKSALPSELDTSPHYQSIHDTVASARLDCVVSALCNLSRDKADEAVKSGLVSLNYSVVCDRTKELNDGDIVSVRGKGKFKIVSLGNKTKKDRLRLDALKLK